MKVHLIAIGGAVMHNVALALSANGHEVTGSDDEIYEPARSRLSEKGLLPEKDGWFSEKITTNLDCIILGMHARKDNPELAQAIALGVQVYSFPAYVYEHAKHKKRVVVAGSHGKTTTTSMIMHVLKHLGYKFDYLVGAQLEGFERMVQFSDAPIMVIEGDEYLSSPTDPRPKIMHYKPHVAIITGVAWDHINVFPTFENYVEQFENFSKTLENTAETPAALFYYKHDKALSAIGERIKYCKSVPYESFESITENGISYIVRENGEKVKLAVFGEHNLSNLKAAFLACSELGISEAAFLSVIGSFTGAAKRLQTLFSSEHCKAFLDFAHAPSKVKATVEAMKAQFENRKLIACLELHTFSSLNKKFLPQYSESLEQADEAVVYFSPHTLAMKKMPELSAEEVAGYFNHRNLKVFTDNKVLLAYLHTLGSEDTNLLFMSSGTFGGLNLKTVALNFFNV
jgi:UDP-N-acetylmuramate: L-alanyl-gamma-D-glutamyl-meso-diaminopimelate ligase